MDKVRPIDANALLGSLREAKAKLLKLFNSTTDCEDKAVCKGEIASLALAIGTVEKAPSVAPDSLRPKGRWGGGYSGTTYTGPKCSKCGYGNGAVGASNFCPNCGADHVYEYL